MVPYLSFASLSVDRFPARYRLRRRRRLLDVTSPALCLNSQRYLDFGVVFLVVQDDGNVTGDVLVLLAVLRSVEGVRGVGGGQPGSGLRGRGRRQVGRLRGIR